MTVEEGEGNWLKFMREYIYRPRQNTMSEDSLADDISQWSKGGGESAIFKEVIPRMQVKIQTDKIRHTIQPEET